MKYMLDTNIMIYVRNNQPKKVFQIFKEHKAGDLCISSITLAELEFGVRNSSNPQMNQSALMSLLASVMVVPFDSSAAIEYSEIRFDLEKKGKMIGPYDLLIAAHAKTLNLTLVTNNEREFKRIEGLKVENWC